ncbi:7tm 6 domain containing protein, partial [Asbolus verrucosus]
MRVLKNNLQNLGEYADEQISQMGKQNSYQRKIIKSEIIYDQVRHCLNHHKAILWYVELMNNQGIKFALQFFQKSNTLITSVYMGNWYEYDIKSRKALIILKESSKKPMIAVAGKLFELSLGSFVTILKRSYSVLA